MHWEIYFLYLKWLEKKKKKSIERELFSDRKNTYVYLYMNEWNFIQELIIRVPHFVHS